MSNAGVYGTMYEQLRSYADKLDRAIVALRLEGTAEKARRDIAELLAELTGKNIATPATKFVYVRLRRDLPKRTGKTLTHYEALAKTLAQRMPDVAELEQLEQLALTIDQECSTTLARMKGDK